MKYLISAQELYLEVCKKIKGNADPIKAYEGYFEALDLLYQQPKLGDFVATNEDREVMEYPKRKSLDGMSDDLAECAIEEHEGLEIEYFEAKEKVIWKEWEWIKYSDTHSMYDLKHKDCSKVIATRNRGVIVFHYSNKTYEQLITSGVKLERIQKK